MAAGCIKFSETGRVAAAVNAAGVRGPCKRSCSWPVRRRPTACAGWATDWSGTRRRHRRPSAAVAIRPPYAGVRAVSAICSAVASSKPSSVGRAGMWTTHVGSDCATPTRAVNNQQGVHPETRTPWYRPRRGATRKREQVQRPGRPRPHSVRTRSVARSAAGCRQITAKSTHVPSIRRCPANGWYGRPLPAFGTQSLQDQTVMCDCGSEYCSNSNGRGLCPKRLLAVFGGHGFEANVIAAGNRQVPAAVDQEVARVKMLTARRNG